MTKRKKNRPKGKCAIEGCDKPIYARGWCQNHYFAWYRRERKKNGENKKVLPTSSKKYISKESPYTEEEVKTMYDNLVQLFREGTRHHLKDTKQDKSCWVEETDEEILSRYDDEIFEDYPELKKNKPAKKK